MTFYEWVITRKAHDNSRGDFIRDSRTSSIEKNLENTESSWRNYLRQQNACSEAVKEFNLLWKQYQKYKETK